MYYQSYNYHITIHLVNFTTNMCDIQIKFIQASLLVDLDNS